jgi:Peptidase A4 family
MKTLIARSEDNHILGKHQIFSLILPTITVALFCLLADTIALSQAHLAISASAQDSEIARIGRERGFTVPPNVQTPIVLKTKPDAPCDLHAEGVSDKSQTLRFYANGDGYLKIHATAREESQEARVQLDCTENGKVVRYPLHLRAGSSPTEDMPAPRSVMPTPTGSLVLPALTEEEAQQLSDEDLLGRGYLPRPDAVSSPDEYAVWRDRVSRPMTFVPPHSVSRSDISHSVNVQEGAVTGPNWSGFQAYGKKRSYDGVQGEWNVPAITLAEPGYTTYSSMWVGLDGNNKKQDLVQAGSEQDAFEIWGILFASYSTWTELLPNQPTSQGTGLGVNSGDNLLVSVYIGDSTGHRKPNGAYGWFSIWDWTSSQAVLISTALNGTYFTGISAEWIMERPTVNGVYSELSFYLVAPMWNAGATTTANKAKKYGTIQNRQITMYEKYNPQRDNHRLSAVRGFGRDQMLFQWFDFH